MADSRGVCRLASKLLPDYRRDPCCGRDLLEFSYGFRFSGSSRTYRGLYEIPDRLHDCQAFICLI